VSGCMGSGSLTAAAEQPHPLAPAFIRTYLPAMEGPRQRKPQAWGTRAAGEPRRSGAVTRRTPVQVAGSRYYSPGLGRWTSRDPIGERGGVNLGAFVGNNAIGRMDGLGLMTRSEVMADLALLENMVSKTKCCCPPRPIPVVQVSINAVIVGEMVTGTLEIEERGCVKTATIYWWDCFSAQDEAPLWTHWNLGGYQPWQAYGWHIGGRARTMVHAGGTHNYSDADHWNWTAGVLYTKCGEDGYWHASWAEARDLMFAWNPTTHWWTLP
jgi:RHS repeat-associated protein